MDKSAPEPTDETLMAYADGELGAAEAAVLEGVLARDAQAARRLAMFRDTRARLAAAAAAQDDVPAALRTRIEDMIGAHEAVRAAPNVTPIAPRRDRSGGWQSARPALIAASLALAVGMGTGLLLRGASDAPGLGQSALALLPEQQLAPLLDTLPAGQSGPAADGIVTAVASFRDGSGRLCREVEVAPSQDTPYAAILCRAEADGWRAEFALRLGAADGFAPASGLEALDSYLVAIGAGPILSPEEEAAALAAR